MTCEHANHAELITEVKFPTAPDTIRIDGKPAKEGVKTTFGWWCRECGALMTLTRDGPAPRWVLPAKIT